jgi:hypothetical protein|tara:strand:+ start:3635 stop:4333 length:699 start_codon:yes stop_codon:yes gene_type:complete
MANKLLVTGYSGTGKTHSLRNLDPKKTFIICPDEKALPFKGWKKNYISKEPTTGLFNPNTCNFLKTTSWEKIRGAMAFVSKNRPDIEVVVIDTITYAMIGEFMEKAKTVGFAKFTEMGDNVYKTLKSIDGLRDDLMVIVMAHTEVKSFNGADKTVFGVPGGKLVQDVVKPEGMFLNILETVVEKKGNEVVYGFMTQNNTTNMAKSSHGMFSSDIIPNDMQQVLDDIKKYEEG